MQGPGYSGLSGHSKETGRLFGSHPKGNRAICCFGRQTLQVSNFQVILELQNQPRLLSTQAFRSSRFLLQFFLPEATSVFSPCGPCSLSCLLVSFFEGGRLFVYPVKVSQSISDILQVFASSSALPTTRLDLAPSFPLLFSL